MPKEKGEVLRIILILYREMRHCKVLQILRKRALVIYMIQIVVIYALLSLSTEYRKTINSDSLGGLLFVVPIIVTMIISYSMNLLFNQRCLRILLGRV